MLSHKETADDRTADGSQEIQVLLTRIEDEEVPERLLTLARELQSALNLRKRRTGIPGDR